MKTIIFDLGNVLIYFDHQKIFTHLSHCTQFSPEIFHSLFLDRNMIFAYEKGIMTTEELHQNICKKLKIHLSFRDFYQALTEIFWPNSPMIDWVFKLKKQKHQLLLLSNTCEAHFSYLQKKYPMLNEFDTHILSHREGCRKPDLQIYKIVLDHANNSPDQCYFFDDLQENIEPANQLGIHGVLFKNIEVFEQDLKNLKLYP